MTLRETMALLISEGVELKTKRNGKLDFNIKNPDTSIMDIGMPNRGVNALMRNGARTVGDVLDLFERSTNLKGVGEKTLRESKQALIEWNWSMMTQSEQRQYLETLFV